MKRALFVVLALAVLLPLLIVGCAVVSPATTSVSPSNAGTPTVSMALALTADDFAADAHPIRNVSFAAPDTLSVTLDANPTTGYEWSGNATISGPAVRQSSYGYIEPTSTLVGAPGKSVWVFDAVEPGSATITLSYARPWESVPPTWTLTVNVTVK
jgi:inhibitor of cysteine peptidase